jgi:hypothetical protein
VKSETLGTCEACLRMSTLREVGTKETGDDGAMVCVDAVACQRTVVAAKRKGADS